jgi:cell wall assembly regulator SMI1
MKRRLRLGIGIAVVAGSIVTLSTLARAGLRSFFYPTAPRMPAVVREPMSEVLTRLDGVLRANAPHVAEALQPGLSAEAIAKLEEQNHVQLPDEIKSIYGWHNGSARTTNYLSGDFIPGHRFLPLDEALAEKAASSPGRASWLQRIAYRVFAGHRETWICLFSDGAGDGYWFDPKRKPAEGAVFFNFTETMTYEFFPSAKNLMAGVAKCYERGIFRVKAGSSPPELDEDFQQAAQAWDEYGASNQAQSR